MNTHRLARLVIAALVIVSGVALAQSLPKLTVPVNDFAGVIDAQSAAEMDRRIRALLAASGDTVVVATVDTFAPYGSIEEFAVKLFEQAGIGDRERDRGVLVVMAVQERRVRIEVGYGLEEFITDGFAGEVIRLQMLPAFRSGEFGPGLLAGVTAVIQRIGERRGVTVEGVPVAAPETTASEGLSPFQIVLIILVLLAIASIGSTRGGGPQVRGRGRNWHGGIGGFGGGFGGFGGGGFGGGFGGGRGGGFGGFGGGRSGGGGASGGW